MAKSDGKRLDRVRAFCCRCHHVQLFRRVEPEHSWHLFLSIITGGLWLISWVSATVLSYWQPWQCQRCGWQLPRSAKVRRRSSEEELIVSDADVRAEDPGKLEAPERTSDRTAP